MCERSVCKVLIDEVEDCHLVKSKRREKKEYRIFISVWTDVFVYEVIVKLQRRIFEGRGGMRRIKR